MDTVYGTVIAYAAPVFLLAIGAEILVDRLRKTRYYSLPDAITSVGCGTAFVGSRIAFGFIGLLTYEYTLRQLAPVQLPAGHWLTWVFAFVLYDFCYYWWHRLSHTVAFLWGAHVVHHQSEEFNLTTALRQPATGLLTAWIFYLPLALCGVPLQVYLGVGVAQQLYQFWPHTRYIGRLGRLDRWIQTPSNHRVHHAHNGAYLNKNYVGVFLSWDHLFGTFEEENEAEPCKYGVAGEVPPGNPMWANVQFYWGLACDSWQTHRWTNKLRVWFASPGWRPPDVAAPSRRVPAVTVKRTGWISLYGFLQFAAILTVNQHFLSIFPEQTPAANAAYFATVFIGLTTVSVVLEGRREFFVFEMARLALLTLLIAVTGRWFTINNQALLGWMESFLVVSIIWFGFLWSRSAPAPLSAEAAASGRT